MELKDLYARKGELVTSIEVAQAQLQSVNQEIVKLINNKRAENVPVVKENEKKGS